VADALAATGGTTPDADPAALNKAAALRDGMRVYVPRYGETPPAGSVGSDSERRIDVNHASTAELESLPGIGPSTAARIVRAREQKSFTKVEELQTRGLVSARTLSDIRDLVTIR
jgi:competence protein ComEA